MRNQAVITKIARKSVRANRGRSIVVLLAVFLTTFMLTTVLIISLSYMESQENYRVRLEGTTAHIGTLGLSDAQLNKLAELDYVESYATGLVAADVKNDNLRDAGLMLAWLDDVNWEVFRKPAFTDITGRYPTAHYEIMVPIWVLSHMGIDAPELGMDIPITYSIDANSPVTRIFKLSGYFTSYIRLRAGGNEGLFVSEEFALSTGHTVLHDGNIQIRYTDDKRVGEYNARLAADLSISPEDIYPVAKYNPLSEESTEPVYFVFAALMAILLLVGYLLIYNVLSVSVEKDIRFYGLFKTIGATSAQIRKSVLIQILYICCAGIPLGLLASTLFSLVLVPVVVENLNGDISQTGAVAAISCIIYILAAVFTLITALIGALRPAQRAARITPIEAVRYTEPSRASRKPYRSSAYKPIKAAWRNVFRVRGRAVLVILSLFLGMTLFAAVTTILNSANIDEMVKSNMANIDADIYLKNRRAELAKVNAIGLNDGVQVFSADFVKSLESLNGYSGMKLNYAHPIRADAGVTDMSGDIYYISGEAFGIEAGEISAFKEKAGLSFDADAFERGEFVVVKHAITDIAAINVLFVGSDAPVHLNIGGEIESVSSSGESYAKLEVYMSSALLSTLANEPIIHEIDLHIEKSAQRQALSAVNQLTAGRPDIIKKAAFEIRKELEKIRMTLFVIGGGISAVLWLIGALNFISIIASSILARRHELAVLESIGQSSKQSVNTLTAEGLIYATITLVLVCTLGGAFTYGMYTVLANQFDYVEFDFAYLPLIAIVCAVYAICAIVPRLTYRSISKMTLVERLREKGT